MRHALVKMRPVRRERCVYCPMLSNILQRRYHEASGPKLELKVGFEATLRTTFRISAFELLAIVSPRELTGLFKVHHYASLNFDTRGL